MKKSDVFKAVVMGISAVNPGLGLAIKGAEKGIEGLIHRDNDPTNDLDETADALTDIVMNVSLGVEAVTSKDYINDPALKQLADNLRGDIKLIGLVANKLP